MQKFYEVILCIFKSAVRFKGGVWGKRLWICEKASAKWLYQDIDIEKKMLNVAFILVKMGK